VLNVKIMKLEITESPREEDDAFVISKTRQYNLQFVENKFKPISLYFRNAEGEIIAGLTGKTFWSWLHVEYLWVDENERCKSFGSKLMLAAEEEAISRGCIGSTLDTFSVQALDFYKKLGYTAFGSLSGYAGKLQRHYLQKKFV